MNIQVVKMTTLIGRFKGSLQGATAAFRTSRALAGILLLAVAPGWAQATIMYTTWTTNQGDSGNYILTVTDTGAAFDVSLTVDPWNAEALGLFVDLGDFDYAAAPALSAVSPVGEVALYAVDTASNSCGAGCNLNGLSPLLPDPDGEWELVFRLGAQGYDGIQTFSFSIDNGGNTVDDWGVVGIRAQQLCDAGELLPGGTCDGSDKSYGSSDPGPGPGPGPTVDVPEPATLLLAGLGLAGFAGGRSLRRGRKCAA